MVLLPHRRRHTCSHDTLSHALPRQINPAFDLKPFSYLPVAMLPRGQRCCSDTYLKGWLKRYCLLLLFLIVACAFWTIGRQPLSVHGTAWDYSEDVHVLLEEKVVASHAPYIWDYNHNGLLSVYQNKSVGFPELMGSNCRLAFKSKVNNTDYRQTVRRLYPLQLKAAAKDCRQFRDRFGFSRYPPPTQEELDFPLAFTILFYKDLDQVLFLLRAVYRPHNVYCLHIDSKSSIDLLDGTREIIKCLPNVFVSTRLVPVVYESFNRLAADINCMRDLLVHPVQWKYLLNIPGQQFPLRTNLEIVNILKLYNGSNDVEGITGSRRLEHRYEWKHVLDWDGDTGHQKVTRTKTKNHPPPHNLEIVKGSAYGSFSRRFVEYIVHSPVAHDFMEWCQGLLSPDEYFWSTLHYSKVAKVPGGNTGPVEGNTWLSSYSNWGGEPYVCATIYVRGICIFSPQDLHALMKRFSFFANKFYITHHPAALHCLDELIVNQTFSGQVRDLPFYTNLLRNQTKRSSAVT